MAGKVDIQVAIGADARPLEKEVAKARGSVHGLARDVEAQSKKMTLGRAAGGAYPAGFPIIPKDVTSGPRATPLPAPIPEPRARPSTIPVAPVTRITTGTQRGGGGGSDGIAAKLVRRPEFNFMGRMEGLLGGFTLGGLMMWGKGVMEAAEKSKELARAAKLPIEEFVRLQKAAKDNQIPVEALNAAIKDYGEGTITLQQVGEAVGIIGMKAGGASEEVKRLAGEISDLAELNKNMEVVAAGAESFGKRIMVGISKMYETQGRMLFESIYRGRPVGPIEAWNLMKESRQQEKDVETNKAEKALKETRATIKVKADLDEFFGDIERQAAKGVKIKLLQEQLDERIAKITVKAPSAGDSLARIGGFMGGRMDNKGIMIAERQLRVAEETAEYTKQVAKAMAE